MKYKSIIILCMLFLVLTPFVSATFGYDDSENIGTFQRNKCVELTQTCYNCTYNNISRVIYPNSTVAIANISMTKDGTYFNYSFCNTQEKGEYRVTGYGDINTLLTDWDYRFEITQTGDKSTTARSIMFGIILCVCLLFLGISLLGAVAINGKNEFKMGRVIKINYNKYLKQGLLFISYLFLTFASGMAWTISENYLSFDIAVGFFEVIFHILIIGILPVFIMFVSFSLIKFVIDLRLEKLRVRNLPAR